MGYVVDAMPRVFVSYAHDGAEHTAAVGTLSRVLASLGFDVRLDTAVADSSPQWVDWMERQVAEADFVLVIASPLYLQRARGDGPPDEGRGVWYEARLLREQVYRDKGGAWLEKIVPIVLPGRSPRELPAFLTPYSGSHVQLREISAAALGVLVPVLRGEARPVLRPESAPSGGGVDSEPPHQPTHFVGREAELTVLSKYLSRPRRGGRPPVRVVVLEGLAGSGKSTLMTQAASQHDKDFDGRVLIRLRGSSEKPLPPADLIRELAIRLGGPASAHDDDATYRRYRETVDSKRVLIMLDDAHDADQIRQAVSVGGPSVFLVTSRVELRDLPASARIGVGALSEDEAVCMLAGLVGAERVDADPEVARRIVRRCGNLPIAISLVTAHLTGESGRAYRLNALDDDLAARGLDAIAGRASATTSALRIRSWRKLDEHPFVVLLSVLVSLIAVTTFAIGGWKYLLPAGPTAPPRSASTPSEPTITTIENTVGKVGVDPILKINYVDAECDISGGRWDGQPGFRVADNFGAGGLCIQGHGAIFYERTCLYAGQWREYVTLLDARGHQGPTYELNFVCVV
ncbi:NB-ARC domain-containing protein [Phytohabitans houttuyneae]|nr:NB-ARC domain-containing protein [Phytohabitans houttuyneae]